MNRRGIMINKTFLILLALASAFIILLIVIAPINEASDAANNSLMYDKYVGKYADKFKPDIDLQLVEVSFEQQSEMNLISLELDVVNEGIETLDTISVEVYSLTPIGFISEELYVNNEHQVDLGGESTKTIVLQDIRLSRPSTIIIGIDTSKDVEKTDNSLELEVEPSFSCDIKFNVDSRINRALADSFCKKTFGDGVYCSDGKCELDPRWYQPCSNECGSAEFCSADYLTAGYCLDLKVDGDVCTWTVGKNYDDSCESGHCGIVLGESRCLPEHFVSATECCYMEEDGGDCSNEYDRCIVDKNGVIDESYPNYVAVGAETAGCMSDCVLYCQLNEVLSVNYDNCKQKDTVDIYEGFNGVIVGTDMDDEKGMQWIKVCELLGSEISWDDCWGGDHFYGSTSIRTSEYVLVGLDVRDKGCMDEDDYCAESKHDCVIDWARTCKVTTF